MAVERSRAEDIVHNSSRRIDRPFRRKQVASLRDMLEEHELDAATTTSEQSRAMTDKSTAEENVESGKL